MKHPLDESVWRRGWNYTKKIWTSWQFYVLSTVVAVVIGGISIWYYGVYFILFVMFCAWLIATASAPIKQRNEAREQLVKLKRNLGSAGYIEACIYDAIELKDKLKYWRSEGLPINPNEIKQYQEWYSAVSKHLQQEKMHSENIDWYSSIDISHQDLTIDNVIKAYESGLDILKGIHKSLTNQENSQTQQNP